MTKKKSFYVVLLILGLILIGLHFFITADSLKTVAGLVIGIGGGLCGLSLAKLYMLSYENKHPDYAKSQQIEEKDERSIAIRYRAKAKAADIAQWLIILFAAVLILLNAPLWMTLVLVIIYLFYSFGALYFMYKYNKEM